MIICPPGLEPRTIEAVIFDMDGVIVDSEPIHEAAQAQIFDEYDLPVPQAEYMSFKGRPERDVFTTVLKQYEAEERIDHAEILARKHFVYQEMLADAGPIGGALEAIQRLRSEVRLGLVTSSATSEQQRVFSLLGLNGEFEVIITADDIERAKPHPDPYLKALGKMSLPAASALVVEDSLLGVKSASDAGCFVVGLVGTFSRSDLEGSPADLVVDTFDDLMRLWDNPADLGS
jgi:beta-phosphoglucomutase